MSTFVIDCDNNITAFASLIEAKAADIAGARYFSSAKELDALDLGASRLAETWNGFAGAVPFDDLKSVKKFENRYVAVSRIWRAVQRLAATPAPQGAQDAPKAKGSKKKATSRKKAAPAQKDAKQAREGSKKAQVLELLRRPGGATLAEIQSLTRWVPHTIRGLVSTLGKKMKVESFKTPDGERAYRLS
jgi:hypothetical protein